MFLLPPLIENTKRVEIIQGYEEMQFLNTWLSITKNSNRNRKKKRDKKANFERLSKYWGDNFFFITRHIWICNFSPQLILKQKIFVFIKSKNSWSLVDVVQQLIFWLKRKTDQIGYNFYILEIFYEKKWHHLPNSFCSTSLHIIQLFWS